MWNIFATMKNSLDSCCIAFMKYNVLYMYISLKPSISIITLIVLL